MDNNEKIEQALDWANKRLQLLGEPITDNQRSYLFFALKREKTTKPNKFREELKKYTIAQQEKILNDFMDFCSSIDATYAKEFRLWIDDYLINKK